MSRTLTTEEFLQRAIKRHGKDRYDYTETVYVNSKTKVKIKCLICNHVFWKLPDKHTSIDKEGCPECIGRQRYTTETWVEKMKKIHSDKYDYSKVVYKTAVIHVTIICKTCGDEFEQLPCVHIKGIGCPNCGKNKRLTLEEFLRRAKEIHGDKFDYSKVKFKNTKSRSIIRCTKCNFEFKQYIGNHIRGSGCPKCIKIISEPEIKWLDSLGIPQEDRQKKIRVGTHLYKVDACVGNTVYEFHGDFWHGNPKVYNPNEINPKIKLTFQELYEKTLSKEQEIREAGYNLITMWEYDWLSLQEDNK